MNLDVNSKSLLDTERSRIINELVERAKVFTSLTEQEIFDLLDGREDVELNDWLESLVSTQQQLDTIGTSTLTIEKEKRNVSEGITNPRTRRNDR